MKSGIFKIAAAVLALSIASSAWAVAVRPNAGFTTSTLAANDDLSTGLVPIGFSVDFFGTIYNQLYVNNNGNVTFDAAMGTYTPFNLLTTGRVIIAPFFGDVDTRTGNLVTYGQDTVNGQAAFGVNWLEVGYYSMHLDKLNSFQLVIIDRSDVGAGDFDFEFNIDQIQWETGDASSGSGGLGGSSARSGWSNGVDASYELAGSAQNGAFLDGGPFALALGSLNSTVPGRYLFQVRNGQVEPPDGAIPEPLSAGLAGLGLVVLALTATRRRGA